MHDKTDHIKGLEEASEPLREAIGIRLEGSNATPNSQWDWTWRVVGRVPKLNKWFFAYGLLDCAVQLRQASDLEPAFISLQTTIRRLASESSDESLKWKAVSLASSRAIRYHLS